MAQYQSQNGKHPPEGEVPVIGTTPALPAGPARSPMSGTLPYRVVAHPAAPAAAPAPVPAPAPAPPDVILAAPPRRALASGMRLLGLGIAAVATVLVLSLVAWFVFDPFGTVTVGPLQTFADQGHTHIPPGAAHPAYNSTPATSGWHREEFLPVRIITDTTTVVDDEVTVHLMEHGNVVVFYDCAGVGDCGRLIRDLAVVVQAELDARGGDGVYMVPRKLPAGHKVALGAWTRLQYLDGFKEQPIQDFIDHYTGAVSESRPMPTPTP